MRVYIFEKYLEDTSNEELDQMVDVNIKGTYRMTGNALPKIMEAKGNIVIIASCLGLVPELTSPLYCATKAGLIMLKKCLAQQYADVDEVHRPARRHCPYGSISGE